MAADAPLRLVVTGRDGQVSRALQQRRSAALEVVPIGRPEFDLAEEGDATAAFAALRPDVIVNAAAHTAVDRAESEPELAFAANARGAGRVAAAAAALGVPVIQISTDYVFDGATDRPWREDDPCRPINVYGASKLAGEEAVRAATANHAILRTSWVYAPWGANFVRTMLRLAEDRDTLRVVADQRGTPTSAPAIAEAIERVARNLVTNPGDAALRGVFHLAAEGETTWAGFAEAIFARAAAAGRRVPTVVPIPTVDYPTPARRPLFSRLDTAKIAAVHGVTLPPWTRSLDAVMADLLAPGAR